MGYRDYSTAKGLIVDASGHGDFSTLSAAMAAASSGKDIFVRPGTYIGDVTFKAGVNVTAFGADYTQNVTIQGNLTFNLSGNYNLYGLTLNDNGGNLITMSGSNNATVNIENCTLNITSNSGISVTNASATLALVTCNINIGMGISGLNWAGSTLFINYCNINGDLTALITAGTCELEYGTLQIPFTSSGTGNIFAFKSQFGYSGSFSKTWITTAGASAGINRADHCSFYSGSASCISVGSSFGVFNCVLDSSNTNVITGAGTVAISGNTFSNVSSGVNTSTIIYRSGGNQLFDSITFDSTNFLNVYNSGTWTPTITGASAAGATTYTLQEGTYIKIGKLVTVSFTVAYTAATGTGNVLLGALPFTIQNVSNYYPTGAVITQAVTYPVGTTTIVVSGLANTTTATMGASGSTSANTNVQMENATRAWFGSFSYIASS